MNEVQTEYIHNLLVGTGIDEELFAHSFRCNKLMKIPEDRFDDVVKRAKAIKRQQAGRR